MKTRILTLGIAGLAIAAGCAIRVQNRHANPQTRYIVKFEQPTLLIDRTKFIEELKKGSWRREITFTPEESGDPSPTDDRNPTNSRITETGVIWQDPIVNQGRQHVTQRVGFNVGQRKDVDALLELVSK